MALRHVRVPGIHRCHTHTCDERCRPPRTRPQVTGTWAREHTQHRDWVAERHLLIWTNELPRGSSSLCAWQAACPLTAGDSPPRPPHLHLKPFICGLWNTAVTFEMQRGLEVQMTVNMNINSSVINNWSCLPDTWLLIKGSEGAQAKPETPPLRALVPTGTEAIWILRREVYIKSGGCCYSQGQATPSPCCLLTGRRGSLLSLEPSTESSLHMEPQQSVCIKENTSTWEKGAREEGGLWGWTLGSAGRATQPKAHRGSAYSAKSKK